MKTFDNAGFNTLVKTVVIAAFMAVGWPIMAQESPDTAGTPAAIETEQVNINHADAETIARVLVGVGMSRAEAIVAFREEFGEFASLEELQMVNGVGEVTLRNNQARISFD